MNDLVAASADPPRCRHCGAPLVGLPRAREAEGYRCEGCFLAAHRHAALPAGADDGQYALGEALVAALDAREHETGLHSKRVACHTLILARHYSADPRELQQVYLGALLHDIGKIGIPDSVLRKDGPLTEAEWRVMRTHPEIGHRILAHAPALAGAAELVLSHEERFDGTGYPRGLAGEAIPLWARLFAVIDTLDAMTSDRPYRKGLSYDKARSEIECLSGTQFDPQAVKVFVAETATLREMVALKCDATSARNAILV
ncbi:MAG TPA: HD domain-containing phosphohydrolase [Burkholderiales bacterium]|nr:HD domain-containing phosphohydrolase [Burkholderiales bacterium]